MRTNWELLAVVAALVAFWVGVGVLVALAVT